MYIEVHRNIEKYIEVYYRYRSIDIVFAPYVTANYKWHFCTCHKMAYTLKDIIYSILFNKGRIPGYV
jgi:hypothetical protein